MKSIFLLFLFSSAIAFCQDSDFEEVSVPFEYHTLGFEYSKVWVEGRNFDNFIDGDYTHTAELPYSGTSKYLERRQFYHTDDNRFVELIEHFSDNTYFFKEWSDSTRWELLNFGELEVNTDLYSTDSTFVSSVNGEDSLVIDTVFSFRKIGPWEFRANDNSKFYGNYDHGKRTGTWTQYLIDLSSNSSFFPVLAIFEYEKGKLKSTNYLDKTQLSYDEKLAALNGNWKNFMWDAKTTALCRQGLCIFKFHKIEKSRFPVSDCIHVLGYCGIGHTCKQIKWQLNQDGTLIIEGRKYEILYLTDEYLMLKSEG